MLTIIVPDSHTRQEIRSDLIENSQVWADKTWYGCADGHSTTDIDEAVERDIQWLRGTMKMWQDLADDLSR